MNATHVLQDPGKPVGLFNNCKVCGAGPRVDEFYQPCQGPKPKPVVKVLTKKERFESLRADVVRWGENWQLDLTEEQIKMVTMYGLALGMKDDETFNKAFTFVCALEE